MCETWLSQTFSATEREYYAHVFKMLAETRALLLSSLAANDDANLMKEAKEKTSLYEAMITKCHPAAFCDPDTDVWQPYAAVLSSPYPYVTVMKDWLAKIISCIQADGERGRLDSHLESYLVNLIGEIPLPPPGKLQVEFKVNDLPLFLSLPPLNRIPVVKDISLCPLLTCLPISLILTVYESMLNEKKIVLLSSSLSLLSTICESFRILSYPFTWQYVYVRI